MNDIIEHAMAMLLDDGEETIPTAELRAATIDYIMDNVPDADRTEVEAIFDGLYPPVVLECGPWMG